MITLSIRLTRKLDLAALISFITLFLKDTNICLSVNELDLRECFKALSLSFINLLMSLEIQGRVYLLFPLDLLFLKNRFVMFWIVDMRTFVSLSTSTPAMIWSQLIFLIFLSNSSTSHLGILNWLVLLLGFKWKGDLLFLTIRVRLWSDRPVNLSFDCGRCYSSWPLLPWAAFL